MPNYTIRSLAIKDVFFSAAKLRQDKNYSVRRLSSWDFPALKPENCNFYMGNFTCFEKYIL